MHGTFGPSPVCPACKGLKIGHTESVGVYMSRLQKLNPVAYSALMNKKREEMETLYRQKRDKRRQNKAAGMMFLPIALIVVALHKLIVMVRAVYLALGEHFIKARCS